MFHIKACRFITVWFLSALICPTFCQWKLLYEEDFSTPLVDADWFLETYEKPFDTILDDNGDWYKNDYGPAFSDALNSFQTYRKEFMIGQDGWLTASLSARDSNKDGTLDSETTLVIESLGSGSRRKNVLTMKAQNHTGGVILRPTYPLPEEYRIEYKLTGLDFGGRRNGNIVHPDGKINGYSPEGCKTQHPWGEGSQTDGWSGNASAPYCDWQGVRTGPYAYNGFHFLTIVDFSDPAPRNNHFWHYRRKVLMDSFSQHPDRIGDGPGGQICDADTMQYYNYSDSDSFVTLNMWISAMPGTWTPNPGGLVGNAQRFITDCNGGKATGGIQSAGELLTPEALSPGEYYTFAIERNASGYTLEASGRFARVEFQKYRFFRPFEEDGEPIWHYNVNPNEYDGRYNGELRQDNWAFGSQSWPDQWPAGSAYPDYFVIGDLYTNVYEGQASVTDIRLFIPDTTVETPCNPIVLLQTNEQIDTGVSLLRDGFYIYQRENGALEVWTESPQNPGSLYWENGVNEVIDDATYFTLLQGDGNLITSRVTSDGAETVVWKTYTTTTNGNFFFVIQCEGQGGGVALYEGSPDQGGNEMWSDSGFFWLSKPTMVPQQPPVPSPPQQLPEPSTCLEPVTLMQQGDALYVENSMMSDNNEYHLYQAVNGNLELWEGTPESPGRLLWETGIVESIIDVYYTTLQSDSNLVTRSIKADAELVIWESGTFHESGNYQLFLHRCESHGVVIKDDMNQTFWSEELLVPLFPAPSFAPTLSNETQAPSSGGERQSNVTRSSVPAIPSLLRHICVIVVALSVLIVL